MSQLHDLLSQSGVLIKTKCSWPRLGQKLKPEDLGLPHGARLPNIVLGHKRLLGSRHETLEPFKLLEGRLTALVAQNTQPFMDVGHFAPNGQLEFIQTRFRELETEWNVRLNRWMPDYPALREAAIQEWNEWASTNGIADVSSFIGRIAGAMPVPDKLQERFDYRIIFFRVEAPENMQVSQVGDTAEHLALAQAREEAAQRAQRAIAQEADGFIKSYTATLREGVSRLANEMLGAIDNCQTGVHQKTLNRLEHMWEWFGRMNFHNDEELRQLLEQARTSILSRNASDYRENEAWRQQLRSQLGELADQSASLARQDSADVQASFMELGRRRVITD